ncbi:MAG: FKBP-type peptidyl-prolyl cis-trans isomerase, partial [Planctomycetota bacterium]|nr:FKBP-type peptidyl-prolyl cis-trans isomerase [Planctomycetota bacterium]
AFGDKVKVHYAGWFTDGKLFDSSYRRGEPTEFAIGQVIEGWNEGLALMSPGAKFKLTIPYDLAYGEAGRPPQIPAKSTLIFEVELIAITAKAMPYVDWSEERETISIANGITYQVLTAGEGLVGAEADSVSFDFARYDAEKKVTISSSMIGAQVGPPSNPGIPFLKPIMGEMKPGSHLLIRVPKAMDISAPAGAESVAEVTVWQLKLNSAQKFEKPVFSMPTAEQLTTTASGLQYQVLREGDADGAMPTNANKCTVHYSGWLTDGTGFDSSYERGAPATFGVTQVISGWTEGLKLMKVGAKYKFVIPGNLAYKERGSPPKIGPNATLVFVVELLNVQ